MSMVDFITEFERLYNNIKKYETELPTGVLAYKLLKSAEISEANNSKSNINFTLI